jgi:hypothetical protein
MFAPLVALALSAVVSPPLSTSGPGPVELGRIASWIRSTERQRITIWTNHDEDPYRRGDEARVYFKAETDGYVTVLRVDTDGRVRVLFPREPWEDNFARGGRTFEVLDRNDHAFQVDDYPGVGYVFAVSSPDPYRYDDFVRGDHWDYRLIADGRVRGDPYVSLTEFASQIAGPGEYDYDITQYYVEQHYDYPRFVCYDCHSYVSYSYWNPYHYSCNRFRIVIYDDYYYYPYRYNRGRNVVITRPYRPQPRYVFKDYNGQGNYVTRVRQRTDDEGRRVSERDRTSADIGGRGSIPAPVEPRGRRSVDGRQDPASQGGGTPDAPRRRTGDQPDVRTTKPTNPGTSDEPRRRPGDNGTSKPNILPRDNATPDDSRRRSGDPGAPNVVPRKPDTDQSPERRRPPQENAELRAVDPGEPDVLPPTQRRSSDEEETRSDPRPDQPTRQQPARSDPRPDTRADPRRADPPRSQPSYSEPRRDPPPQSSPRTEPRRADPAPQSRPQPTGDPQLRRRKP